MSTAELASSYAALILADEDVPVTVSPKSTHQNATKETKNRYAFENWQ